MNKEQLNSGFPFEMLVGSDYYKDNLDKHLRMKQNSTHVIHFTLNALVKDK